MYVLAVLFQIVKSVERGEICTRDPSQDSEVGFYGLEYLKIGFISPRGGDLGYETIASATTMAVEDAQNSGCLPGVNVR